MSRLQCSATPLVVRTGWSPVDVQHAVRDYFLLLEALIFVSFDQISANFVQIIIMCLLHYCFTSVSVVNTAKVMCG